MDAPSDDAEGVCLRLCMPLLARTVLPMQHLISRVIFFCRSQDAHHHKMLTITRRSPSQEAHYHKKLTIRRRSPSQETHHHKTLTIHEAHCLGAPVSPVRVHTLLSLCEERVVHFFVRRWITMEPMTVREYMGAWDATHVPVNRPCIAAACSAPGDRKRGSGGNALPGSTGSATSAAPEADCVPKDACVPCTCVAAWLSMSVCCHNFLCLCSGHSDWCSCYHIAKNASCLNVPVALARTHCKASLSLLSA